MRMLLRAALAIVLAALMLVAIAAVIGWVLGVPHQTVSFTIDDNGFTLPATAGGWLLGMVGVAIATLVVLVVVPLSLLLGFGLPALLLAGGLALGLAIAGGVLALVCSPLLLPVLFVAWLLRRDRRAAARAASTRIA